MVYVDRWFVLAIVGMVIMAVSAAGEFLGWWDQLGEFGFWFGIFLTLGAAFLNATRAQARDMLRGLLKLDGRSAAIEAHTALLPRIEENTSRLPRIEENTARLPRIEENTARLPRIEEHAARTEEHTAETVRILRDIRDRLS